MPTVRATRHINASSSKIWTVLSDFNNIQIFHPNVLDVDQLSQVDRGLGAERRCNFYSGGSAVEKIISWDDERQFFTCTVTEIAAPILDVTAGMRVNEIDSEHSEVH
ncbi:MAG: SRPBCC family protein, partial [Gammaproteobacteria bacterium]|nr:SRPBCC family protein [Gammaproteobacteria bacterium]